MKKEIVLFSLCITIVIYSLFSLFISPRFFGSDGITYSTGGRFGPGISGGYTIIIPIIAAFMSFLLGKGIFENLKVRNLRKQKQKGSVRERQKER